MIQAIFLRRLLMFSFLACGLMASGATFSVEGCPNLSDTRQNDYRDPSKSRYLRTVERAHFDENVRTLRSGARGSPASNIRGDLEYTLNWFPNHHGALETLMRYVQREGSPTPRGAVHIECRFRLARQVAPGDGIVPMLHGQYLYQTGQLERAKLSLAEAADLEPANANIHYNAGLLYFRMNDHQAALTHARRAYELGFPLPGLRNLLERAGYSIQE